MWAAWAGPVAFSWFQTRAASAHAWCSSRHWSWAERGQSLLPAWLPSLVACLEAAGLAVAASWQPMPAGWLGSRRPPPAEEPAPLRSPLSAPTSVAARNQATSPSGLPFRCWGNKEPSCILSPTTRALQGLGCPWQEVTRPSPLLL